MFEKTDDYKKIAEGKAEDDRVAQEEFEEYEKRLFDLGNSIKCEIKVIFKTLLILIPESWKIQKR